MKVFKHTIKCISNNILHEMFPNESTKRILNSRNKITNRKLIEEIFEIMINTELWKTQKRYCICDVKNAIGKCLLNRLDIDITEGQFYMEVNDMTLWYLECAKTMEYAVVFAHNKMEAFKKLKAHRQIDEEDYKFWKVEEFTKDKYDAILYFS